MISNLQINGAAIADDYAGYAPIVLTGETDRYPFTSGVRQQNTVTGISDSGGKLLITISGTQLMKAGDTVFLSGLEGDADVFNTRHQINTVTLSTILTTTDWQAVTSSTGTVTRLNDGLIVRMEIKAGTTIGILDAPVRAGGLFSGDVGGIIKTAFTSIFTLTAGAVDPIGFVKTIEVDVTEVFQDKNYQPKNGDDDATGEFFAHATTDFTNQLTTANTQHQTRLKANRSIFFHALHPNAERVAFKPDNATATTYTTIDNSPADLVHVAASFVIPVGARTVEVTTHTAGSTTPLKPALLYIVPPECTNKCLYWLNQLGGYTSMPIVKYEDRKVTEKIDRWNVESYIERTVYSVIEPEGFGDYLQDLIDSPEVRDETGKQVYLIDGQLKYRGEEVQAVVTLKIEKEWIN